MARPILIDEVIAPAHWQAVDLVSDLHLSEGTPHTLRAFIDYLAGTSADAVFILGDLVAYWVGEEQAREGADQRLWQALAACAQQRWVGFMVGNRDFLVTPDFLAERGLHALGDPCALQAFGQRYVLSHGDALCVDDQDYQRFRAQVRSSAWQQDFLAKPYAERQSVAKHIRARSEARKADTPDPELWADVDAQLADDWLSKASASALIHGHTHRPGARWTPGGHRLETLSDWDLDTHQPDHCRAEVLRLGPDLKRIRLG